MQPRGRDASIQTMYTHQKQSAIIRDYLMAFWLSPDVSTLDPIISPRALARRLIMVEG